MRLSTRLIAAGSLAAFLMTAMPALADGPKSLEEAKKLATEQGKPLLVDFYTEW